MTAEILDLAARRPKPAVQTSLLDWRNEPAPVARLVPRYLDHRRLWIERECLKMAAAQGYASRATILLAADLQLREWGATEDVAAAQIAEVAEFVDARLDHYRDLTGLSGRRETGTPGGRRRGC